MMVTCTDTEVRSGQPSRAEAAPLWPRTFSLLLYSDLRVVKTGGQPLLKFILRYLSRHSLNFSPGQKEDHLGLGSRRRAHQTSEEGNGPHLRGS